MALIASAASAGPQTLFVPGQFPTIQAALNAANDGDRILLEPGTYVEGLLLAGKKVVICGANPMDPLESIIDGDNNGPIFATGAQALNEFELTFKDLTFQNAVSTVGGVGLVEAGAVFQNVVFRANEASLDGGAVKFMPESTGEFFDCTFEQNAAGRNGGAISADNATVAMSGCTFTSNTAQNNGGAISLDNGTLFELDNAEFSMNNAGNRGGAIDALNGVLLNVDFARIILNIAGFDGGGLALDGSEADIENTDFEDNQAQNDGGAVVTDNGTVDIKDSTFLRNSADNNGGAISGKDSSTIGILNTDFLENTAMNKGGAIEAIGQVVLTAELARIILSFAGIDGGALALDASTATFGDSRFEDNQAQNDGGAIASENSTTNISTTTFVRNSAMNSGGAISNRDGDLDIDTATFVENFSEVIGGALRNERAVVNMTVAEFIENFAGLGGGATFEDGSVASITDATFLRNVADSDGGAVFTFDSDIVIENSSFTGNGAAGLDCENTESIIENRGDPSGSGGAVANHGSGSSVMRCIIFDTNCAGSGGAGSNDLDDTRAEENGVLGLSSVKRYEDCTFTNNFSLANGGALLNLFRNVEIDSCQFENNTSQNGGAMAIFGGTFTTSVIDSSFTMNAASTGGAIESSSGTHSISGCVFDGNTAGNGPAINYVNSRGTIGSSVFMNNDGALGGAINNEFASTPTIERCRFIGNIGSAGGAIRNDNSDASVLSCEFYGNRSRASGGAITNSSSDAEIANCLFTGNDAEGGNGGAILNVGSSVPMIVNCTFASNTAAFNGGAVLNSSTVVATISNSILVANSPNEIAGSGAANVSFSIVENGFPGVGNLDADPLFVDPIGQDGVPGTPDDDLDLSGGSPGIDAADAGALDAGITLDVAGNARFVDDPDTADTGAGSPTHLDIGAYEFQGDQAVCSGDCDLSGNVDFNDLVSMLFEFGAETAPVECDADGSGTVDFNDLVAALFVFGPCPG